MIGIMNDCNVDTNCTTPNNENGECIPLNSCEVLRQLIRKKPIPYQDRAFLRASQCSILNGEPWVCCVVDDKGCKIYDVH